MSSIRVLLITLCLSALLAVACSDDPTITGGEATGTADVFFDLNVNGAPLQLNSLIYTHPSGTKYSIKILRFIISDLKLHTDTGTSVMLKKVHYFDISDASTQSIHVTSLPHANYVSVSFRFGLSTANNVPFKYPDIPPVMYWPTSLGKDLGYHYMQMEGVYEGTSSPTYLTHTGPRHLDGTNPDYPGVSDPTPLDFSFAIGIPFTPAHVHEDGHGELDISMDLNGWYTDHTPADGIDSQFNFTSGMIMGDTDAQGKLQTNGPGCFSATMVAHGGHDH